MPDWYKKTPTEWNQKTDNLSLEQEAALLRIVNAIHIHEQPLTKNMRVLGGLWRCNERKAKRLFNELIDLGKITIEDDCIVEQKAIDSVSIRVQLRIDRQLAGSRGGIESGKSRAKSLKTNKPDEASGSTRVEEKRVDKIRKNPPIGPPKKARRIPDGFPSQAQVDWAMTEKTLSQDVVIEEVEKFKDYWHGAPGAKGTKLDWPGTWRNWIRRNTNGNYNGSGHRTNGNGRDNGRRAALEGIFEAVCERDPDARFGRPTNGHGGDESEGGGAPPTIDGDFTTLDG